VRDKATKEPFDPKDAVAVSIHEKGRQAPLNDSYAFTQNPRLGLQPEYSVSIYPGTGTVDGRTGDHVLLAPAYNTTESDIKLIADTTVKVIEDFFAEFHV